ncbi:MAG TPA: 16S rRNA (guanine(527)-N(7))-methyltransferase RsmG [Candidatus Izemoplasmatales bacterium]|nr:16S rRNA (guanine(527)-N(7))-methyltransferase RsmG [Candidatus Izemoplasmatales bacterium]
MAPSCDKMKCGDNLAYDFQAILDESGLELKESMYASFARYYDLLMEGNAKCNLTAITDKEEVYRKHFLDSLALAKVKKMSEQTLLDVGSGAGFPSLPLKIAFPKLRVTIVDSLGKRIAFLEDLVMKLGLNDVSIVKGRAEEYGSKNSFDIVTARAVAKMNILTELCLPFVKPGGSFLAMKSSDCHEELEKAKRGIAILGGKITDIIEYDLGIDGKRSIIIIDKIKKSADIYPRLYAKISKNPL